MTTKLLGMAAPLRGRVRGLLKGLQLHILRNGPPVCLHDGERAVSMSPLFYTGSCSPENANVINDGALVRLPFKSSGYYGVVVENGFFSTPCTIYAKESLHKTMPKDGVSFDNAVLRSSSAKHLLHSKGFHTCKPALVTSCKLELKTCGGILPGGRGRKVMPWTGCRSFSSLNNFQSSVLELSSATNTTEAKTNNPSANDVEDFDFTNFPALKSSFFENYERPSEMTVRKKRAVRQSRANSFGADKKLTEDSIPKPRGRTYDFNLGYLTAKAPPLKAGARPQGGFDIDISVSEHELDTSLLEEQSSLPLKISIINNRSETSKDSHIIGSQISQDEDFQINEDGDFQTTEDRVLDHEQDLLWDLYNGGEACDHVIS